MLKLRSLRPVDDLADYVEIYNASNIADQVEELTTVEEMEHLLANPLNFDPSADVVMAEWDGRLAGVARLWWRGAGEGSRIYWHEGHIRPELRRFGMGGQMLAWLESRALARAAAEESASTVRLQVYVEDTAAGKQALLSGAGYQPVRYWHFMRRPTLDDLPDVTLAPDLEFRPAQPSQLRAIWEAREEAFANHWGAEPPNEARFRAWFSDTSHDLSIWPVIWDTASEQIAAVSLNRINAADNERFGFKRGWIHALGVRPGWRKLGLGRAVLLQSLHLLRAAGMNEVVLGVDTGNETGALQLYETTGFVTINKDAIVEKQIVNG